MGNFATGVHAIALCDRCGQQYDYLDLRKEWNGLKVCPECFETKHPQLEPTPPPFESQALYEPRPARIEPLEILVGQSVFPLLQNTSTRGLGIVGTVEVTIT